MPAGRDYTYRWYGARVIAEINAVCLVKLVKSANLVVRRAKLLTGIPGTPNDRSQPGEPPRRQSTINSLNESIGYDLDITRRRVRVGPGKFYGKFLEQGTRFMKPRPWLRRSLLESIPAINDEFRRH